jgi:uncharacterized membrane protein YecN with MAPEG domain
VRTDAIRRSATAEYLALSKLRKERVKNRALWLSAVTAITVTVVSVAVSRAPSWVVVLCGVSIVLVGGRSAHRLTGAYSMQQRCPRSRRHG